MSIPALARTTPVTPPIVKSKINPTAKYVGVASFTIPSHIVASHEKIFTPVGIAITIVAAVK
jgi:hypothetical protein